MHCLGINDHLSGISYLTVRAAVEAEEEEDLYLADLVRAEGDGLESAMDPGKAIIHAFSLDYITCETSDHGLSVVLKASEETDQ